MGELTVTTFISLDGVMQAPGAPDEDTSGGFAHGGWLVPFFDPVMSTEMNDIFSKASAFLLGRGTYDIFSAHWPHVTETSDTIANSLNSLPKYVASRKQSSFTWYKSSHIEYIKENITDLKSDLEGELQVHGSPGLLQSLLEMNLVDEHRIFVFPVTLGTGKRLFGEKTPPRELLLQHSKITTTGAVFNVYRRGGEIRGGSFALD